MNSRQAAKIAFMVGGALFVALLIFQEAVIANVSMLFAFATTGTTPVVIVVFFILVVLLIFFWPRIKNWYAMYTLNKSFGVGKEKMYKEKEMVRSVIEFVKEFGIERDTPVYVADQFIDSITSDTPCGVFMATTCKTALDQKNPEDVIPENQKWFVMVDRRTNERSFLSHVSTWEEALAYQDRWRANALPLEKKQDPFGKSMIDKVKAGYAEKLGQELVGPGAGNGGGMNEGSS